MRYTINETWMSYVSPPQVKSTWAEMRARPHRHQRMTARAIRSLRVRLCLTQIELGRQCGVSAITISRWERANGAHPPKSSWNRIKELWWLSKWAKTATFLKDRVLDVDFSQ